MPELGVPQNIAIIVYAGLFILGVFVGVLWISLPFAVFGTKKRLDAMNEHLREMSHLLESRFPPIVPRAGENVLIRSERDSERDQDVFSSQQDIFSTQRRY